MLKRGAFWAGIAAIVVFGGVGVFGLASAVGWVIAGATAVIAVLAGFEKFNEIAGRLVGAAVVGTLALFGVNVGVDNALDWLNAPRPPILAGLGFAVVIFAAAAAWYLRGDRKPDPLATASTPRNSWTRMLGRGSHWGVWTTLIVAFTLSVFLLVDVPIIVHSVLADDGFPVVPILAGVAPLVVLIGLGWWCRRKREGVPPLLRVGGILLPAVGVLALAAMPILVQLEKDRGRAVPARDELKSRVDVRIVTDGSPHPAPDEVDPDPALAGFDVRYSVGVADGSSVRWTLVASKDRGEALQVASLGRDAPRTRRRPATRRNADSVLLLLPDGTPPVIGSEPEQLPAATGTSDPEVGRWRQIARAARGPNMPAYVALQTKDRARMDRWRSVPRKGGVVSLQTDGHRAATDTALAHAIDAPGARSDLTLAIKYRPLLLFDRDEPVPRPLSVDWLFRSNKVRLCRDLGVAKSTCDEQPTTDPLELANDVAHLRLERTKHDVLRRLASQEAATGPRIRSLAAVQAPGTLPAAARTPAANGEDEPETAIYVHPVRVEREGEELLYLDYWWYLPDNPVTVGMKAFCGAGLVIPGVTCHDHQSDWEGMTVVVDRASGKVRAVHYAEHEDVVRIEWEVLRERWDGDPKIRKVMATAEDGTERPLAFVAKGTHSTYPDPCPSKCEQIAHSGRGEDVHDGELPWIGNFTNLCGAHSCVHRLPTTQGGRAPASWNAFTGPWGTKTCALTYFCDSAEPPSAPGSQDRYQHPTRCSGFATLRPPRPPKPPRWKYEGEPCA